MSHASQGSVMGVDVGPTWFHVVIAEPTRSLLRIVWIGTVLQRLDLPRLIARFRFQGFVIDAMPETHQARGLVQHFPVGSFVTTPGHAAAGPERRYARHAHVRVSRTESLDAMYLRWRTGEVAAPGDVPEAFIEQIQGAGAQ